MASSFFGGFQDVSLRREARTFDERGLRGMTEGNCGDWDSSGCFYSPYLSMRLMTRVLVVVGS